MNDLTKHFLRGMAWEEAKGKLRSMLMTFNEEYKKYEELSNAIEEFIKEVEDNGLQE